MDRRVTGSRPEETGAHRLPRNGPIVRTAAQTRARRTWQARMLSFIDYAEAARQGQRRRHRNVIPDVPDDSAGVAHRPAVEQGRERAERLLCGILSHGSPVVGAGAEVQQQRFDGLLGRFGSDT